MYYSLKLQLDFMEEIKMEIYYRLKTTAKTEIKNYGDGLIAGKRGMDGKTKDNKRNDIRVKSE